MVWLWLGLAAHSLYAQRRLMPQLMFWLMAVSAAPAALALQVTDDRGVTVTFERSPQRIVSLLPSLTETVCGLGQCHRLVGVDRYSNYPLQVRSLPQAGGGIDPNIEAIVALRPDVVLMAASARGVQRLESLGVKVLAMEPKNVADVRSALGKLGDLLEVADSERIWRAIDAGVAAAAQSMPPAGKGLRVYYEVSVGGYAAGPTSFIGETLQRLGLANIVSAGQGPFPRINPEYVVRANPDLIMIGQRNALGLAGRPGWSSMRAVSGQRICTFNSDESDVLVRPGPRMAEAARLIARCVTDKVLPAPR